MQKEILMRLLEVTIYSAVLLLAVLLARLLLRRWLSPALKYALWFIVLVRLMVPVTLESSFHLISLPETQAPAAVLQPTAPTTEPEAGAEAPVLEDNPADNAPALGQTTVSNSARQPGAAAHALAVALNRLAADLRSFYWHTSRSRCS